MADANIRINVETATLEQLNDELARLQAEVKKVAVGSAEFKKLSAEVRRVDGAVEGANRKLKSLDVGAVAGDVAKLGGAVASASALFKQFGAEGSSSQEAIQSALETTNTILGAGAIAEGVASAARLAGVAATKAASAAQAAYAAVVGTSTGALKAFKIALASTGIGLVVVALGELIANWDKLVAVIGGSTKSNKEFQEENEKLIAQLDKQNARLNTNIERQKALGESEKELLRQRVEGNQKAADQLAEQQDKAIARKTAANAAVRKENSESNREELKEAQKISDDLLIEQEKYEKEREVLRKEGLNLRLKDLDFERDKAVLAARKTGQDVLVVEKQFAQKKLQELKNSYIASKDEIEKQEFEIAKIEEEARQERIKKAEEAAQKRRAQLKKDFEDVVAILKEQDLGVALGAINVEQKLVQASLERATKSGKDFTAILKELKKDGLEPYANFLKTVVKDGDVTKIGKAIDEAFGKKRVEAIKSSFSEIDTSLTSTISSIQNSIDAFTESAVTGGFVEFTTLFIKETKKLNEELGGAVAIKPEIKIAQDTQEALKFIQTSFDEAINAITETRKKQEDEVKRQFEQGLITQDQAAELIFDIDNKFTPALRALEKKREQVLKQIVDAQLKIIQDATQEGITKINQDIAELEIDFVESTYNKIGFSKIKAEDKFAKERLRLTQQSIKTQITGYDEELTKLEEQKKKGLLTEEDYAKKVKEINTKKKDATIALEKSTTDATVAEYQRRQALVQAFFDEVKKYYDTIAQSVQALGNIIADQAAIQDLRYSEELEKVQGIYDEKFKLIDEEENKLDDLEQAKDTNLSKTERKRRALAKERAALEAQQQADLAKIENARANAAADAAIKQAEVNFALATGQILISTAEAVAKSIAQSPTTFGLPFSAFAVAQGAIQIAAANSARQVAIAQAEASRPGVSGAENVRVSKATGGLIEGPGNGVSDSVPANLSNGEFVVNANATQQFLPLLNQINQSGLQGGNPVNPSGGSDSAMISLLERIDQKLGQPNRSYVVLNDIENLQNKQQYINRRSNVL